VLHSPHAKTGRQLSAGQHVRPFGVISRLAHLAQLGEDASSSMVSVLCCAVLCCAVLCCAVLCCAVQAAAFGHFIKTASHAQLQQVPSLHI